MPLFERSDRTNIQDGIFLDLSSSQTGNHCSHTPPVLGVNPPDALAQSPSDIFAEELLVTKNGYPLWRPDPQVRDDHMPPERVGSGVRIGDVGFVTPDGSFDYIFNVYFLPEDTTIRKDVPDDFSPLPWLPSDIRIQSRKHKPYAVISSPEILRQECPPSPSQRPGPQGGLGAGYAFKPSNPGTFPELVHQPLTTQRYAKFKFEAQSTRGAILVIPGGGSSSELINPAEIRRYAERNAVCWYRHVNGKLGLEIPNGRLYVITGFDECASWGSATFSNPEKYQMSLRFGESYSETISGIRSSKKYYWSEDSVAGASTQTGPDTVQTTPNQCLFLRGYRIALKPPPKIPLLKPSVQVLPIKNLTPKDLRVDSGSYIPFGVDSGHFLSEVPGVSSDRKEQHYVPKPPWPYHPADAINSRILEANNKAQVSLVHDDDWISVINDSDIRMPDPDQMVQRVFEAYVVVVDQDGHAHLRDLRDQDAAEVAEPVAPPSAEVSVVRVRRSPVARGEVKMSSSENMAVWGVQGVPRNWSPKEYTKRGTAVITAIGIFLIILIFSFDHRSTVLSY